MALCRASLVILFVGVLLLKLMALMPACQTKVWTTAKLKFGFLFGFLSTTYTYL